jgi:hypothetical protein
VMLGEKWRSKLSQSYYQYRRAGFVNRTSLSFDRAISENYFFRDSMQAIFTDRDDTWEFSQTLSTYHILDERNVIDYRLGLVASNRPSVRVTNYYISTQLRRLLYKDWFFMDLRPAISFPRDDHFKANPSFTIRFQVVFDEV